jgi:hypothetical protein
MQDYVKKLEDAAWSHIRAGSLVGGTSGKGQVLEGANIPTVHLLCLGSNNCISGFRDPCEARRFRSEAGLSSDWHIVDLRSDRPRYTRSKLEEARRAKLEEIFDQAEFDYPVVDMSGWEFDGDDRFTRPVFLEMGAGDSVKVDFQVEFRPRTPEDWTAGIVFLPEPEDMFDMDI